MDTNVYLAYYELHSSPIFYLSKLLHLVKKQRAILYLPETVLEEFDRRREVVIARTYNELKRVPKLDKLPAFCSLEPAYRRLKESESRFQLAHERFISTLRLSAAEHSMEIDYLIESLFAFGFRFASNTRLVDARQRVDFGSLPGKRAMYGDALIWLSLLDSVPKGDGLTIITKDSDFISPLRPGELCEPLAKEWCRENGGPVSIFSDLERYFISTKLS